MLGTLDGHDVAFLPRHGRGHRILPHELNFRANIFALKSLGVQSIISVSAVGSMKEGIRPGELVAVDQFIDRTKGRAETFFGHGIVAHVGFADPVARASAGRGRRGHSIGAVIHKGRHVRLRRGPAFSSRAESNLYHSWALT
jgi:5'-methylthioadenosine phosphorylase